MTGKKRKSGVVIPAWSSCCDCNVIISSKHGAIHKEKSCPPNFQNWIHPFIANGFLYSTCDIFQPKSTLTTEKNLEDICKELRNDFVFIASDVLQLCKIPLGDHVAVKTCGCSDSFQIVKKAWSTKAMDLGFGVCLSSEVADLYDLKPNTQVVISKVEEFPPAKSVTVVCETDSSSANKGKVLLRLKTQNLNKIYCVGNKILLRHYGSKAVFRIVEMSSYANELKAGDLCLITVDTRWQLSEAEEEKKPKNFQIEKLGGMGGVVTEIEDAVGLALRGQTSSLGIPVTRGVLIHGPAGTGKTTLIEALAEQLTSNVIKVEHSKILSKIVGETEKELRNLFSTAELVKPSAILIDDLDVLCSRSNSASEFEKRVTATLCLLMDELSRKPEACVVVLGTTSKIDSIDEMLRCPSRFGKEIDIPVPSCPQRFEILKSLMTDVDHDLNESDLRSVSESLHGFVGADIMSLVSKAVLRNYKRCEGKEKVGLDEFQWALSKVKPSAMREIMVEVPNVRWEDIGGQEDLKLKLQQCIDWPLKHRQAFRQLGITPPKGVLLFGPPGCSKTTIAKAVATESKLNFISVKGPELFSKWVGESERAVREVFRRARQAAPSVVFFDELDAIGGERNTSAGSNVQERVLAQLLTELDGVECLDNVTVIAATNRVDRIDPALIRPGRLDRIIYVPLPDRETREEIFRIQFKKTCIDGDVAVGELVALSQGYSGAEVVAVCREAALKALEEDLGAEKLRRKHFLEAFNIVLPRTPKSLLDMYDKYL